MYVHICAPYEAPYFTQVACVDLSEPARKVVSDPNVVGVNSEVLQGDMDGKEGRREKKSEKQGMGHLGCRLGV